MRKFSIIHGRDCYKTENSSLFTGQPHTFIASRLVDISEIFAEGLSTYHRSSLTIVTLDTVGTRLRFSRYTRYSRLTPI